MLLGALHGFQRVHVAAVFAFSMWSGALHGVHDVCVRIHHMVEWAAWVALDAVYALGMEFCVPKCRRAARAGVADVFALSMRMSELQGVHEVER